MAENKRRQKNAYFTHKNNKEYFNNNDIINKNWKNSSIRKNFLQQTSEEKFVSERKSSKVKVGVFLSKRLMVRIRKLIRDKYPGFERGMLSHEFEMALSHWLALHTNTQEKIIQRPNPLPKIGLIWAQIKDYLLRKYYEDLIPGQHININHLIEAIKAVRGSDERTVRKWLSELHKAGLIKPITSATWEVL